MSDDAFDRRLEELARAPVLLVATDYDGTLAPIVPDPDAAHPHREAVVALRLLADLPQTHVAVISGRSLRDLARLARFPETIHLVGSHGSEFDLDFATALPDDAIRLRTDVASALAAFAERDDGFLVEEKPASVAFHYRNADEARAKEVVRELLAGPATWQGVSTKHGKKVVELAVVATDKGTALETMRRRLGASAVLFVGDDVTDEDAFATLAGPDVGVKVGPGATRAQGRVDGPRDVARLLARLSERRADWLAGADAVPIERHSMLSDLRTVALTAPDANISWLCFPRLDSPAIFAELLGGPGAGHFRVGPVDGEAPEAQRYVGDSLVLETRWPSFTVTDWLEVAGGRPAHRAGRTDLVRLLEGSGRIAVHFAPRLDYGRAPTRLVPRGDGLEVEGTHDPVVLHAPGVAWTLVDEGPHQTARAELDLAPDAPLALELRLGTGSLRAPAAPARDRARLAERYWAAWAEGLAIPDGPHAGEVRRSALLLKGLQYGPTGALAAAATTSLPEHVGGVRNWDYRYCWLRDGAMTAAALVRLGSQAEAMQFLDWVLGVVDRCASPARLRPLYTVTGDELGPEAELGELAGYRGSRPVRVGNGAAHQVQLDVFGPIVDLVALLGERDAPLSSEHWRLVDALVQAVARRWREPDHGIWEIRAARRHHVHSKVMCWLTVDRAMAVAQRFFDRARPEWRALREDIAADVLAHGYKQDLGGFTAAYDGDDPDAAALFVGLTGFLPPDDPRFAGTVALVEEHLREGPTVYRYRGDDGLPGFEGGFHICASWLVESYRLLGRADDARALLDEIRALAGPTGLLPEQYGPHSRRSLGNVPQAYSHIGLIENALAL